MAAWVTVVFLEAACTLKHLMVHLTSILGILTTVLLLDLNIAIYKGLKFIDTASDLVFRDIWILNDSRASIQHLSHWTTVGDMTSLNILYVVVRLSSRHSIYFHWVPSHIGLNGNNIAYSLTKSATVDALRGDSCLNILLKSHLFRGCNSMHFGECPLLTLGTLEENLIGISNLMFLGIDRRLYHVVLVATSSLLLMNKARKSFQRVKVARLIRLPEDIFLIV
ncbi:autophagy protein 5 [Trichonephila clavipes]|nr:autophagy protein 5 [Trichonephila clavipes]